jgi:hypothetical protein
VPIIFDRRGMLLGAGAALAGAALIGPVAASADDNQGNHSGPPSLPQPKPIPGGTPISPTTTIHVFAPGPTTTTLPFSGLTLEGLDVEPSPLTDFGIVDKHSSPTQLGGFSALVYPVGAAHGSDGKPYNLEGDIRVFSGDYVPLGGSSVSEARKGTFGLV